MVKKFGESRAGRWESDGHGTTYIESSLWNGPSFQQRPASEVTGTATNHTWWRRQVLGRLRRQVSSGKRALEAALCPGARCQGPSPAAQRQRKLVHGEQTAAVCAMVAEFPGWQPSRHIKYKCVLWHNNKPQEVEVLARKQNFCTETRTRSLERAIDIIAGGNLETSNSGPDASQPRLVRRDALSALWPWFPDKWFSLMSLLDVMLDANALW